MEKRIAEWYKSGRWTIQRVKDAVMMHVITPEQYEEITGEPYSDR